MGRLFMARDSHEMITRDQIVYVDLGAEDNVKAGDFLTIFRPLGDGNILHIHHATNENPLLSARAADIAAFINAGGGLFGLTQDQVADAYDYLGPFAR